MNTSGRFDDANTLEIGVEKAVGAETRSTNAMRVLVCD
jgi:hypothetical protein